jgi:hypothetical protein
MKPPRFPPWLFSQGAIINYGLALMVVFVDCFIVYRFLHDGVTDFQLACITLALTLALFGCFRTMHNIHRDMSDWKQVRREWEELHERSKGK